MNSDTIPDGIAANVTFQISQSPSSSIAVQMTGTVAAAADGSALQATGIGASIAVAIPVPPAVGSLSCTPATLVAPAVATCAITLTQAAPAGGASVILASNNSHLSLPTSATVAGGAVSTNFQVSAVTAPSGSNETATITATLGTSAQTASLTLLAPPQISALSCTPVTLLAPAIATCAITLTQAAGASGLSIILTSNNSKLSVPGSVIVAAGAASTSFQASANIAPTTSETASITAALGSSTKTTWVTLSAPPQLLSLACTPATIQAGTSSVCTIVLTSAGSADATVSISSSAAAVTVPATITIPLGSTTGQFTASAASAATTQSDTLTAALGSSTKSASLSITAIAQLSTITCAPGTINAGESSTCTISLTMAAPSSGLQISLLSSARTLSIPFSASVAANASAVQFTATASSSATSQAVTVTAAASGASITTTINTLPLPIFYLHGNAQEIIGTANGSLVTPTITPSGFTGTLTIRGNGFMSLTPVQASDGLSFHTGGQQSTNTAFANLRGRQVGSVFNRSGQISFSMKSAYSFAERNALAVPNDRYAFDVYDNVAEQYYFRVYTSGGRLIFAYGTDGCPPASYTVPVGQEDAVFGKGIVAAIRIVWDENSSTLFVNDQVVNTGTYTGIAPTWNPQASFTIGAQGARGGATGAFAFDDAIADFQVH